MSDRELLEAAAKAASYEVRYVDINTGSGPDDSYQINKPFMGRPDLPYWITWNPLTDDGDALRLAVECGMNVYTCNYMAVTAEVPPEGDEGPTVAVEPVEGDEYLKATRRAIVRAAAEIGKALASHGGKA